MQAEIRLHAAIVYRAINKSDRAEMELKEALRLDPALEGRDEVRQLREWIAALKPASTSRQTTPSRSHGQAEFPGGLFLRAVHRDESIYPVAGMKPERRSQMREVERSRGRHSRQEVGLAKIQRQIP